MQHQVISKSVFAEVLELISTGQLAAAERICNSTISQFPNDPNITGLLGALLVKMKKYEEAEKHLKRTIELAPTLPNPMRTWVSCYLN